MTFLFFGGFYGYIKNLCVYYYYYYIYIETFAGWPPIVPTLLWPWSGSRWTSLRPMPQACRYHLWPSMAKPWPMWVQGGAFRKSVPWDCFLRFCYFFHVLFISCFVGCCFEWCLFFIIEFPCEADVFIHIQYLSYFLISVMNDIPLSGAMPANNPHASLCEQQLDKRLQDIPEYRNVFYWFRTQ